MEYHFVILDIVAKCKKQQEDLYYNLPTVLNFLTLVIEEVRLGHKGLIWIPLIILFKSYELYITTHNTYQIGNYRIMLKKI